MDNKEYSKWFSNTLVNHGLTKVMVGDELAKRLGIPKSAGRDLVYKYAKGTRRPGTKNAVHLAKILNMETEEFLNGKQNEQSLYITHLSSLFTLKGDILIHEFNKMNRVYDVAKGINPILREDEFGRNALDYCWLYRNSEGIRLLIDNGVVEYGDFFSSIHHINRKNEKIYLTNTIKLICENNDLKLFDIAYPKANKFEVVESFEKIRFKLGTSFIKEDAINFIAKTLQKYPDIENHLFEVFNLNEKDFVIRNKNVISKVELMRLPSFNELANIVIDKRLANGTVDEELIIKLEKINSDILSKVFKCGVDPKKLKVEENGRLYLKDEKQKYFLTTLAKIDFTKAKEYISKNNNDHLLVTIDQMESEMNPNKYNSQLDK